LWVNFALLDLDSHFECGSGSGSSDSNSCGSMRMRIRIHNPEIRGLIVVHYKS
jgi:hypothetical protein